LARVLIVEKRRLKALDLKYDVQSMGHEVFGLEKLEDLYDKTLELEPNLLIIDSKMFSDYPEKKSQVNNIINLQIPTICLTNQSNPADEADKKFFKQGYVYLLLKPYSEDQLKSKIESIIGKKSKESFLNRINIVGVSNKELIYVLILPLTTLTLVFAVLSFAFEGKGFLTNLTTEFISIVVTITYVNWVFKRDKVKKWEDADRRISKRLEIISNSFITILRTNFKMTFVFFDDGFYKIRPSSSTELLKVAQEVFNPIIFDKFRAMEASKWKIIIERLEEILKQIDRVLIYYGTKLNPKKYALLLDIQEELEDIIKEYKAFQEIFDNPDNFGNVDDTLKTIMAGKIRTIFNLLVKVHTS
jgi:CheY-like chemotaxis protein